MKNTIENPNVKIYATCKNSPECNFDLHNKKDYIVVNYNEQQQQITIITKGREKTYSAHMFSEPFRKTISLIEPPYRQ